MRLIAGCTCGTDERAILGLWFLLIALQQCKEKGEQRTGRYSKLFMSLTRMSGRIRYAVPEIHVVDGLVATDL